MNDDLHTLSGAYALNALPEQEQRLFEEHMARCEACLIEVRGLRETAARLGLAAAETPPPALRSRVLGRIAEIRQEPPIVGQDPGHRPASPDGTRVYPPEPGPSQAWGQGGPQGPMDTTWDVPRPPGRPYTQWPGNQPPAQPPPQPPAQPPAQPPGRQPGQPWQGEQGDRWPGAGPATDVTLPGGGAYPPGLARPTDWRAHLDDLNRSPAAPGGEAPGALGPQDAPGVADAPAAPGSPEEPPSPPREVARPVGADLPSDGFTGRRGRSGGETVIEFDRARGRGRRSGWGTRIAALAATVSTAAAVALGYLVYDSNRELAQIRAQAQVVAAILAAPDAKTIVRPVTTGGSATIVRSKSANRIVFTASGLANLPESKTYELWLMGADGPRPAGLLQRGPDGTVVPVVALPLAGEEQLGLTVEPAGGSAKPTTQPILLTKLPAA